MVCPTIDNPDSCEILAVIWFLQAKKVVVLKFVVNYALRFMAKM
jgi:hypothetical protein